MNDHEIARHLAQRAGDLLMGLRASHTTESADELAALADVSANDLLMTLLAEFCPHDAVLSEESFDDKSRLNADRVWIIDPLDGSWHFSVGDADFAIHVALWEKDKGVTAASVYAPAVKHMMSMDDVVIALPTPSNMRLIISRTRPPQNLAALQEKLSFEIGNDVDVIQCGSVGAKLERMIAGLADVYINQDGFYEWDIAAPLGVARHYGYTVCDIEGNQIELNKPNTKVANAVICHPEFVAAVIKSLA
jgi:3'(2'), 5'-bisphosphate nucleotidase